MKRWLDVATTQTYIFILFVSAGVSFTGAFTLWVSANIRQTEV